MSQEPIAEGNPVTSSFQITDSFADRLPDTTANGTARRRALERLAGRSWNSTSVVTYRSAGKLLVIGPHPDAARQRVLDIAGDLAADGCHCTVLIEGMEPDSRDGVCRDQSTENMTVVAGRPARLEGFLGRFTALLEGRRGDTNLAQLGPAAGEFFDLVLDLDTPPFLRHEVLPPGYYAPAGDPDDLRSALQEIPQMTGEFGKPVYVKYQANICAHGDKGFTGCTRCLDVCPAEAIADKGEKIEVNTSLCQGCGSCVANCPTGALSHTFPPVQEWLAMIREVLSAYRDAGGEHPGLLVYDHKGEDVLQARFDTLPEHIIPVPVEEIGSVGMEAWLLSLAYGAGSVALLAGPGTPPGIIANLQSQLAVTHAMLEGMGYSEERLCLINADGEDADLTGIGGGQPPVETPAAFQPFEKRRTIRMAMEHLYRHAPEPKASAPLPAGATFGEIQVDAATCTLCMSCVAICPVQALQQDASQLQLSFLEADCVQCGLCRNACPEDSITLVSRYLYDDAAAAKPRVLNEDEPFHCIGCGKPFIGRRMYERVTERLAATGNWKVDRNVVPDWLQMCGDCRVRETRL